MVLNKNYIIVSVMFLIFTGIVKADTYTWKVHFDNVPQCDGCSQNWDTAHDSGSEQLADNGRGGGEINNNDVYIFRPYYYFIGSNFSTLCSNGFSNVTFSFYINPSTQVIGAEDGLYRFALVANVTTAGAKEAVAGDYDTMGYVDNPLLVSDVIDSNPAPSAGTWTKFTIRNEYLDWVMSNVNADGGFKISIRESHDYNDTSMDNGDSNWIIWDEEDESFPAKMIGTCAEGATPVNPALTINHNLVNGTKNNNNYNLFVTYNGTITDLGDNEDNATCNLNVNGIVNMTDTDVNLSILQDFNYTLSANYSDWINFSIDCSLDGAYNDTTTTYWYNFDLKLPYIYSNHTNGTLYNDTDLFGFYYEIVDSNLFAVNITWYNELSTIIKNQFYDNLSITNLSNSSTILLNSTLIGNNTVKVEAWDSHTTKKIDNYDIEYWSNGIVYDKEYKIYGNETEIEEFYTKKRADRYVWEVKFKSENTWNYLLVETPSYVYIRTYKGYPHLVTFTPSKGKWIDFVSPDITDWYIERISGTKVKIWLYNTEKKIYFDSIGDLNYNIQSFNWQVKATPEESDLDTALLTSIDENIEDIEEAIYMIPIVMLYLGLMGLGFMLVKAGSLFSGAIMWFMSIGLDFLLTAELYVLYSAKTGTAVVGALYGVFLAFLIGWIVMKVSVFVFMRQAKNIL